MKIKIKESFQKDLKKIKNRHILQKTLHLIEVSEFFDATEFWMLYDTKKLKNSRNFYRIRFWDYRIWFKIENKELTLIRIKHRRDIYRVFP